MLVKLELVQEQLLSGTPESTVTPCYWPNQARAEEIDHDKHSSLLRLVIKKRAQTLLDENLQILSKNYFWISCTSNSTKTNVYSYTNNNNNTLN